MLSQAVAHYHDLLAVESILDDSRAVLDKGLESSRLIFGGRRLSPYLRPHFVTEKDFERVTAICEIVWSAIQKVKDAAILDARLVDELGLTEIEKELVAIDPGYAPVSPTARLDSFLTDDAYSFVELNGESPAGIAFADTASEIFLSLPVMQRFAQSYAVRALEGRHLLLDVLLRSYEEYLGRKPERPPQIAIVDLKDLPTQEEFVMFKNYFESQGYPAAVCTPADLEFDGEVLRCGEFEVDIVYKRLLVNEYLPIMKDQPALLDAYRAHKICMVNSFRSKLIHKKALFAVLTSERHAHLFSASERQTIAQHVPWTRSVREGQTVFRDANVDLLSFISKQRDQLVLKPNDDYGGHGIYIGWASTESEWHDAMQIALKNGDYLVQERVPTAREIFPALQSDNSVLFTEQLVDLDPMLFFGKVGSAFTRLSYTELANVSSGGGMVPTFIINQKK
ncbi:MAG: hypothetical protein WKF84_06660 [Pyrinomonadaceae bacterium]